MTNIISENEVNRNQPDTIETGISHTFENKFIREGHFGSVNTNFPTATLSLEQIISHVTNGNAISVATFHDGYRKKANFLSSQLIGLDFDDGPVSVAELLEDPFIAEYAFLTAPTASSKPTQPKSRVYFVLDSAISNCGEYEALVFKLLHKYPLADPNCKDASRFFYGSTVQGYRAQVQNVLPLSVLSALPDPVSNKVHASSNEAHRDEIRVNTRKTNYEDNISDNSTIELIRSALGSIPRRQSYADWLSCLMAVHSKFPNTTGIQLIEEWSPGYEGEVADKFDSFKPNGAVTLGSLFHIARQHGWAFPVLQDEVTNAELFNARYISEANLPLLGKASIICSPMGTGKTEQVKKLIEEFELKYRRSPTVLYLVHRRSLANNVAQRLGLQCYLDIDTDLGDIEQLVCTPNSISRIALGNSDLPHYDIVAVDEIKQFISHLFGKTMVGIEAKNAFNMLRSIIKNADTVLGLDAYAGKTAKFFLDGVRDDVTFFKNEYVLTQERMAITNFRGNILRYLTQYLEDSSRTVPSALLFDSKKRALDVYKALTSNSEYRILLVTGNTSDEEDVKKFIDDPNTTMKNYDLIIATSVLGTGIDIQAEVDRIYCIFTGTIIPPDELMQFIGRFRKAKRVYVCLPDIKNGQRITDEDVIYQAYREECYKTWLELQYDDSGQQTISESQDKFLKLYSVMRSERNQAMNTPHSLFFQLASHRYEMILDENNEVTIFDEQLKDAAKRNKEAKKHNILNAIPISESNYQSHIGNRTATLEIKDGYERWCIENTYGMQITEETYKHWSAGKGERRLKLFMSLFLPERVSYMKDLREKEDDFPIHGLGHHFRTRKLILNALNIVFGNELHWNEMDERELNCILMGDFSNFISVYKTDIQQLLICKNVDNALNVLRHILRRIGLKLKMNRKGKKKDRKVFILDFDTIEQMGRFATNHASKHNIDWETNLSLIE